MRILADADAGRSSLGWAVIAIFSGYVVTGVWLLKVNRALEA